MYVPAYLPAKMGYKVLAFIQPDLNTHIPNNNDSNTPAQVQEH